MSEEKTVPALDCRDVDSQKGFRLLRGRSGIEINADLMGHESATPGVGRAGCGTHAGAGGAALSPGEGCTGLCRLLSSLSWPVGAPGRRPSHHSPCSLFPPARARVLLRHLAMFWHFGACGLSAQIVTAQQELLAKFYRPAPRNKIRY